MKRVDELMDFLYDREIEIDLNQKFSNYFILDDIIGEGAFSIVVSAYKKDDLMREKKYAVKILKQNTMDNKLFVQEANILSSLEHKNIVQFYECIQTDKRLMLVMELAEGGTLYQFIKERFNNDQYKPFTDEEASQIMKSLLEAIKYMHSKGIVHRDLKPENILIKDKNDLSTLKIIDFNISTQNTKVGSGNSMTQKCGTLKYMAPEQISGESYNKPADLWASGIIMYMVLMGKHPFSPPIDDIEHLIEFTKNPKWELNSNFSEYAKNLFLKLVDPNHLNRYTAEIAINHPWITRKFEEQIPMTAFEDWELFVSEQKLLYLIKSIYFINYITKKWEDDLKISPQRRKLRRNDTYKKFLFDVSTTKEHDLSIKSKKTVQPILIWNTKNYSEIILDMYKNSGPPNLNTINEEMKESVVKSKIYKIRKNYPKMLFENETDKLPQPKLLKQMTRIIMNKGQITEFNDNNNNIDDFKVNNNIFIEPIMLKSKIYGKKGTRDLANQIMSSKELNEEIKKDNEYRKNQPGYNNLICNCNNNNLMSPTKSIHENITKFTFKEIYGGLDEVSSKKMILSHKHLSLFDDNHYNQAYQSTQSLTKKRLASICGASPTSIYNGNNDINITNTNNSHNKSNVHTIFFTNNSNNNINIKNSKNINHNNIYLNPNTNNNNIKKSFRINSHCKININTNNIKSISPLPIDNNNNNCIIQTLPTNAQSFSSPACDNNSNNNSINEKNKVHNQTSPNLSKVIHNDNKNNNFYHHIYNNNPNYINPHVSHNHNIEHMNPLSRAEYKKTLAKLNKNSMLNKSKIMNDNNKIDDDVNIQTLTITDDEYLNKIPSYQRVTSTALTKINFKFFGDKPQNKIMGRETKIDYK